MGRAEFDGPWHAHADLLAEGGSRAAERLDG
jgi:hypothetical protein